MNDWFEVDRAGLGAILERRGKAFAVFELVQNAWDAGPSAVSVSLTPVEGLPAAELVVEDDSPEGWADLDHAFTMFAPSRRAADPMRRGRFNLGEKLVLACCTRARIETMAGTLVFGPEGRRRLADRRERGTRFEAVIRMKRDELGATLEQAAGLIPPVLTSINGIELPRPAAVVSFTAKLPTEVADEQGVLRRTVRGCRVEAYSGDAEGGQILEMGVPVCSAAWPWRLNVLQKVPLNLERDGVTDAFRRGLQVQAVNAMAERLTDEQAAAPWAMEAIGDGRAVGDAVRAVISRRFGDRAVIAVPGDPLANAQAEANGCQVVHGGSLSADAWANVRKYQVVPTTSAVFPTPKPEQIRAERELAERVCPLCGHEIERG